MLLITPCEVLAIAFAADIELDSSAVRPSKIDIAQEYFLRTKLGNQIYETLISGLNPDFTDRYIKPPLAYYIKYGLLDELAVAVDPSGVIVRLGNSAKVLSTTQNKSDTNATVADTNVKIDKGEIKTVVQGTTNDTTTLNQKAYHNDVDEETINRTETTGPTLGSTTSTDVTTESQRSLFISKNLEANDKKILDSTNSSTQNRSETIFTNVNDNKTSNQTTLADTARNDASETSQFKPASITQIQALKARALSDANTLMRKAVRFIQTNPDLFPELTQRQHSIF